MALGALGEAGAVKGQDILAELDANGDGHVDLEEYMMGTRETLHAHGRGRDDKDFRRGVYGVARRVYHTCDLDGDGILTELELEYLGHVASELEFRTGSAGDAESWQLGQPGAEQVHQETDHDGNGRVERWEYDAHMMPALEAFGWHPVDDPALSDMIGNIFTRADVDADGSLHPQELHFATYLFIDATVEEMSRRLLMDLDRDDDGRLCIEEVNDLIADHKAEQGLVLATALRVQAAFATVDPDGRGCLDASGLERLAAVLLGGL